LDSDKINMDVEFKLNIIGLGIKRIMWARLCKLLEALLTPDGIRPVFGHYNRKGLGGYKKYLEKLDQGDPDIIVTSFEFFDDLHTLEQLINENSAFAKGGPPRVVFMEKDLNRFLINLLKDQPSVRLSFERYGELHIQDSSLFSPADEGHLFLEIDPISDIKLLEPTSAYLIKGENVLFYPVNAIESVEWQGKTYHAGDFVDAQLLRHSIKKGRGKTSLLVREGDSLFFCNGLPANELSGITFNYLHIDHVLSFNQLKKGNAEFDTFLIKFRELAKVRCCGAFGEHMREDPATIKSSVPVTICSDFPVINDIFRHILMVDGYQQVLTTEQAIDQTDRLLLSLIDSCEEQNSRAFNGAVLLEKEIFNIAGFAKVSRKQSAKPPDAREVADIEVIQAERLQLIKKLKKLKDQIKNLSGSKILADQERYMNMLASRKLEILTVLLEMAAIWDEKDEKQKRTYEENVLIFHDDPLQASTINNKLEGDGKRLFVDVIKKFSSLKDFVTLNTDILEPFLHEGFIFCYAASKSISVRNLQQFQGELSEKKYPEIAKGIENLKTERSRLQSRLLDLAYLEAYQMLASSYRNQAQQVFNAAHNASQLIENRRFSQGIIQNICLFSFEDKRCKQVQQSLLHTFSHLKSTRIDQVVLPLNLATRIPSDEIMGIKELTDDENTQEALVQEALIQHNLKRLTAYCRKALKEIDSSSGDLLVLVHELDMISVLVRKLRQSGDRLKKIPVLAVFSGPLELKKMAELSGSGVMLAYHDSLFSKQGDDLNEQFQIIFP